MNDNPPIPAGVAAAFAQFPSTHRDTLLKLRELIYNVAASDPRIGGLDEALRWGQPAYLTAQKKTGSTIRLGIEKTTGQPALFFNCNTTLIEDLREKFGTTLRYSKNRAVLIDSDDDQLETALAVGIASALTYHLRD
jgi:hypothetical protein